MNGLESGLDNLFKKLPSLPESWKKGLVTALPWFSLVVGILTLFYVFQLYQAATVLNSWVNVADSFYSSIGYSGVGQVGIFLWVSLFVLLAQAILFLVAFPYLRKTKKFGWNLLLWAMLVNVVYDVISSLLVGYANIGQLIFYLAVVAAGLYVLFQVRPNYSDVKDAKVVDKK